MKLLLRLSPDLTTKADKTRRRFLRILMDNLRNAFQSEGISARVEPGWVRIVVETEDPRAAAVARRVFGVHSVAPVDEHPRAARRSPFARAPWAPACTARATSKLRSAPGWPPTAR
jgi:adenylyl- and sulfurtransferase ThiI